MQERARSSDTPVGKLATERLVAATLDPALYPNGTAFIASDAQDFATMLTQNVCEGRPISIVYANGHEVLVTPVQWAFAVRIGALLGGLFARWAPRRNLVVRSADGAQVITLPRKYRVQLRQPPAAAA